MVCVPCYLMPLLLILWKFIQPFIYALWAPKKPVAANPAPVDGTEGEPDRAPGEPHLEAAPKASCPFTATAGGPASKKDD